MIKLENKKKKFNCGCECNCKDKRENKFLLYPKRYKIYKNLRIKLLKPDIKINSLDIYICGQLVERIKWDFLSLSEQIYRKSIPNFKDYLYYYYNYESNIIPSHLFNKGVPFINRNEITFYVKLFNKTDIQYIELYVDEKKFHYENEETHHLIAEIHYKHLAYSSDYYENSYLILKKNNNYYTEYNKNLIRNNTYLTWQFVNNSLRIAYGLCGVKYVYSM